MTPKEIERTASLLLALEKAGVATIAEARVLFAAAEAPANLSVGEIRDRTGLPLSTVSRLGWKLVEAGWFKYEADATDRRRSIVRANLERLA